MELAEFKKIIHNKDWNKVKNEIITFCVQDIKDLILELDSVERVVLFRLLPKKLASEVFSYLSWNQQHFILRGLTTDETKSILNGLAPDDRTELLEELPGQVSQRLLNLLSDAELRETRKLLGYPEESVGRLMTPKYVAVRPEWTIAKVLEHIRETGLQSETLNVIYVTDGNWKLLDSLDLKVFILSDPEKTVKDVMDYKYVKLSGFDDRELAVRIMKKYDRLALPVVDSDEILVGIVTYDDVMDVSVEETTEDFHKIGAVNPLKSDYSETPIWYLYKKRIGWLLVLVFVNILSSGVIAFFDDYLEAVIALAFFIPLLIDSGGNAGSQSATIIIRAIAIGDVKLKQWLKVIIKEVGVGLSLGGVMGIASFLLGFYRGRPIDIGGFRLGMVVGFSMVSIILASNILGIIIPFLLSKFKVDPAVASSPLITTIADVTGLIIYFLIATLIIPASMLQV